LVSAPALPGSRQGPQLVKVRQPAVPQQRLSGISVHKNTTDESAT
jgi:hypothetical protein